MVKALVCLLCAGFLLTAVPARSLAEEADGAFTLDGRITVNALEGLLAEHLAGVLDGLKALAATDDARSGDWDRVKGPLGLINGSLPDAAALWLVRPDGSYFTVAAGPTKENLKDRGYFPALMAGKDVNNYLVTSKSWGHRTVIVATPIVKDGQVVGALGASLSVGQLSKRFDDLLGLPKDVVFYALDAQGRTALHRDTGLIFQFPSDIGDETLQSTVRKMLAQKEGVDNYTFKGAKRTVIFKRSATTGWVFVVGISRDK